MRFVRVFFRSHSVEVPSQSHDRSELVCLPFSLLFFVESSQHRWVESQTHVSNCGQKMMSRHVFSHISHTSQNQGNSNIETQAL